MKRISTDKIRVLQFIHSSGVTGPGRILYGLADNLDKDLFVCDVSCPEKGPLADDLRALGVKILPFSAEKMRTFGGLIKLCTAVKKGSYHVLHIHSGQYSVLWKALGRLCGIPAIIYTEHVEGADHSWIKSSLARRVHYLSHPVSNMMVDRVIAPSEQTRSVFVARQGMPARKTVVIHNGVYARTLKNSASACAAVRINFGIPPETVLIGTVARLAHDKGHRFLVLAAREIVKERHDVKFMIVGEGPERKNIELLIEHNGLKDYFILPGFRPDAYGIMDCMDIVVQPSISSSESFGLTVVEAMSKSKPVVASDIGCFKEIIEDGADGLLFCAADPGSLKDKVLALINDKSLRAALGRAAEKKARDSFDITITAERTGALYTEVLDSKGVTLRAAMASGGIDSFIEAVKKENGTSPGKAAIYKDSISRYIAFTGSGKLALEEVDRYLSAEDNFILERYLNFRAASGAGRTGTAGYNDALFADAIKHKPVTERDYDERILSQSLEFQIDNYYEPKDNSLKLRIEAVLSFLKPLPGEVILDAGCGVGTFAYRCAKAGAKAYGADYSPRSVETAEKLAARFGYGGKIEYVCCDVCGRMPYPDGFFDKIVAADFIEHIDLRQKEALMREMARVLKRSGEIVIFTPNAVREKLGALKSAFMKAIGGRSSETRLHYGLTDRFSFEKMLKAGGFKFRRYFIDVSRPYLARMPALNEALSLDILWVVTR